MALSPDLLAAATPEGVLTWVNPAWEAALGWSEAELVGGSWPALAHPGDRGAAAKLLGGGEAELRLRVREGEHLWLSWRAVPDGDTVLLSGRDISVRRAAEAQLRAGESRFLAVSHSTNDAIVSADESGRILFWNAAAERIFGWREAEVLGKPLTILMPERYASAHRAGMARFAATGEARVVGHTVELEGVRRDGVEFPLEFSLGTCESGGRRSFTAVIRDISDRVTARQELREAEDRFSEAFGGAAMGLAICAPDGRFMRANAALCELSGYHERELLELGFSDLVHRDDREVHESVLGAMVAGRTHRHVGEQRCVRKNGSVAHVRMHLALVRSADGAPLHLVATLEDVTERRRMLEALSLSETRYRALVENLPDAVVVLFDGDLRLLVVEGKGLDGLGRTAGELEGRRLVHMIGRERVGEIELHYRAALLGEARSFDWETDGVAYWVQVVPLHDDAGRVIGGMSVSRDITERKRAERALEQRAEELERSNAELEQFASVASHDLTEPLRMVTSYLRLLERRAGAALDPDATEYLRFALEGAEQMRALIGDLLSYSRVGLAERTVQRVDTSELVARVSATLTAGLDGAVPTIECGPLPEVSGDPHQLGQLFQNLIGNALKFVPPDRAPHVQVQAEPEGPGWRFSVRDNGIGIEPGDAERIFRMFCRLHGRDEYPGTGVGLAIARKVVERHGGRIWTERAPDGGAVFRFTIAE